LDEQFCNNRAIDIEANKMQRLQMFIFLMVLCFITIPEKIYAQTYEATSPPASIQLRRVPKLPPDIKVSLQFHEPSGNGFLDAEEKGFIILTVLNNGQGEATNFRVDIDPAKVTNLLYKNSEAIDNIQPGETKEIKWPITASFDVESKKVNFTFTFRERNGFEPDPIKLAFETRAFVPPILNLAEGVNIEDANQNGMIEPGEIVKITSRIINSGRGKARDVSAQVRIGENVFFADNSPKDFDLGDIGAGGYRDFSFTVYANNHATSVPVFIDISEHYNKFGKTNLQMPLAFKRPIPRIQEINIAGKEEIEGTYEQPASLAVDVDFGIPLSKIKNKKAIAIIFGVESYRNVMPVPFARRDATIFEEYAKNVFGISDDKNHIYFRTDDGVTKAEFDKVFSEDGWLTKRVDEETDVIIYYAGHGAPELKGKTPYLIPSDGDPNYPSQTGFSLDNLYDKLEQLDCRTITVFLDACFSGGTRENKSLFVDARPVFVQIKHPALRSNKITVFAAAGDDQISSSYPEMKHGLFTYFLLKGLKGDADIDSNGVVTVQELGDYITTNVKKTAGLLDREQTPQVFAKDKSRVLVKY